MSNSSPNGLVTSSPVLILAFALSASPLVDAQSVLTYPVNSGGIIEDNLGGLSGGKLTNFTFTVPQAFSVGTVRLRFSASHDWAADLRVFLKAPDGTSVQLFSELNENGPSYFSDIVFRDDAANAINAPISGTDVGPWSGDYRLESQLLSTFNGKQANGVWTLQVIDLQLGDTGYLYAAGDNSNTVPDAASRFGVALGTELTLISDGDVFTPLSIEDWRMLHFGTTANSGLAANSADFDGDGIPNIIEYGLSRDPTSPQGANGVAGLPGFDLNTADDRLEIIIPMPFVPAPDANYEVKAASGLSDWITIAQKRGTNPWIGLGGAIIEEPASGNRIVTRIQDLTPMSAHPRRFLTLSIVEVP